MKATLIVVEGAKPARVPLNLPTTIGRSDRAKLKLRASLVSRTHCELYEHDGNLVIRDLGSSNGTKVNGDTIVEPTRLNTDDLIQIGPVTLRVLCDKKETLADTEPEPAGGAPITALPPEEPADGKSVEAAPITADPESQFQLEEPAMQHDPNPIELPEVVDAAEPVSDFAFDDEDDEDIILAEPVFDSDGSSEPPVVVTYEANDEGSVIHIEEAADFLRNLESDQPDAGESVLDDLQDVDPGRVDSNDSHLDKFFDNLD